MKVVTYQVISLRFNLDFLKIERKNTFYLLIFSYTSFTIFFTKKSISELQLIRKKREKVPYPIFSKKELALTRKTFKVLAEFYSNLF